MKIYITSNEKNITLRHNLYLQICWMPFSMSHALIHLLCLRPITFCLKPTNQPLHKLIWDLIPQGDRLDKPSSCQYVVDGGSLLQRITLQIGGANMSILQSYRSYVKKRYGKAVIVFDGYIQ